MKTRMFARAGRRFRLDAGKSFQANRRYCLASTNEMCVASESRIQCEFSVSVDAFLSNGVVHSLKMAHRISETFVTRPNGIDGMP